MPRLRIETVYGPAKRMVYKQMREVNKVVGGLIGETYWGWLYIDSLWISEKLRRKNFGKTLIEKAESEARKRGVRNAFVNSFSFQAPGFYRKLGYREFGKLTDFPKGHTRHWLQKAL